MTTGICTHIYPISMCNQSNFMHKLAAQLCMPSVHVIVCLIGLKVLFIMCVLILLQYNINSEFYLQKCRFCIILTFRNNSKLLARSHKISISLCAASRQCELTFCKSNDSWKFNLPWVFNNYGFNKSYQLFYPLCRNKATKLHHFCFLCSTCNINK